MFNILSDSFDIWSTAQKPKSGGRGRSTDNVKHYGIQKLRELILELAVRGKLVPQDPNDEPASELLKRILQENNKLEKDKIKKVDGKFVTPEGWSWVRCGDISLIERGGSPRPINSFLTNNPDGINWIKIGDSEIGGKYITSTNEKIIKEGLTKTRKVYPGDFLLTNSMSFGRPYITLIEGCIHDGWLRIHPPSELDKDYLYYLLSSPFVKEFFKSVVAGAVVQNLNSEKVRDLPIPLPPLNEQKRISEKVDELMSLCDKLEKEHDENAKTHEALVNTLLDTLTNVKNSAKLLENWKMIEDNFDLLFTSEESVDKLKQTILQLAVMGKLVPQDPNNEPASELLKRITAEKEKLIEEGKIKKQDPLPKITDEEKPFELPKGWEWVRFGTIILLISGQHIQNIDYNENNIGVPYITGPADFGEIYPIISKWTDKPKVFACKNDILITVKGAGLGKLNIVDIESIVISRQLMAVRTILIDRLYTYSFLKSSFSLFQDSGIGIAIPGLSRDDITNLIFALPPISEQVRIVDKVNLMLKKCDKLKDQIKATEELKIHLADEVIKLGAD